MLFSTRGANTPIRAGPPVGGALEVVGGKSPNCILSARTLDDAGELQALVVVYALDACGMSVPHIVVGLPQCRLRIEPVVTFTPRAVVAPDLAGLIDNTSTACFDAPVVAHGV